MKIGAENLLGACALLHLQTLPSREKYGVLQTVREPLEVLCRGKVKHPEIEHCLALCLELRVNQSAVLFLSIEIDAVDGFYAQAAPICFPVELYDGYESAEKCYFPLLLSLLILHVHIFDAYRNFVSHHGKRHICVESCALLKHLVGSKLKVQLFADMQGVRRRFEGLLWVDANLRYRKLHLLLLRSDDDRGPRDAHDSPRVLRLG